VEEFGRATRVHRPLDSYRRFLEQPNPLGLYRRAIRQVVRPGDIVADVGAGLGVLAACAIRAGARRVIAFEDRPLASPGRAVVADNGLDGCIRYTRQGTQGGPARGKADVLVLEMPGDCIFEAGLLRVPRGVWPHLRPRPATIPTRVDVFAAPVRDPYFHAVMASALGSGRYGLTFSAAVVAATHRAYKKWIYSSDFLAPARRVARIQLPPPGTPALSVSAEFRVTTEGTLTGFGLWADIWFTKSIVVRTLSARHWQNLFFPIESPMRVRRSDRLSVAFHHRKRDGRFRWQWHGWVGRGASRLGFTQGA
jgi:hypothetical protein